MASRLPWFRLLHLLALLAAGSLLNGCTSLPDYVRNGFKVGPNYVKPPAPVAPQWIDADDIRVRSDSEDLKHWWKVLGDPVLDDLVCHAYQQNLTLREAGFRVLEARAQLGITIGNIFPQTQDITGNYTRTATSIAAITGGSFGPLVGGPGGATTTLPIARYYGLMTTNFNLAWEVDFWGRFRRAIEASRDNLNASVADYDDAIVTMIGDIATNYVQLRVLQRQIELLQENARIQLEPIKIAQAKFDLGRSTELDLAQAKSTLSQTLSQIPQKEIAARQAANRLCVLLGMPPEELESRLGKFPIPQAPKEVAAGIPADLLRRRPDIRRAERQAAAQCAQIGVAEAALYPHISIFGSFGYQAANLNQLFTPLAFQGNYGPSFEWDILQYGRLINNIRYQRAKFREVVTTYQSKVLKAAEEVENGIVQFTKAHDEVKYLAESVTESRKALRIGTAEYETGKTDFNRVAVLEQALVQQDILLTQAQGDVVLGLIQTYRALGGGWEIRCEKGCEASGLFAPECPLPVQFEAPLDGTRHQMRREMLGVPIAR